MDQFQGGGKATPAHFKDAGGPAISGSWPVLQLEQLSGAGRWEACGHYPIMAQYRHAWERAIEVARVFGPGRYRYTVDGGPAEVFQVHRDGEVDGITARPIGRATPAASWAGAGLTGRRD